MQRRSLLILLGVALAGEARGQSRLRPDPTPRLPPQPGQGLPVEDRYFLRDAQALSRAQAELAGRVAQQGGGDIARFAAALAARHQTLAEEMAALVRRRGVGELGGSHQDSRVAEALRVLRAPADAERGFLAAELQVHPVLVEMYQAQASQTTDRELARLAINALVGIQEDYATATRLGAPMGLAPPKGGVANPPQYGPGGPSR